MAIPEFYEVRPPNDNSHEELIVSFAEINDVLLRLAQRVALAGGTQGEKGDKGEKGDAGAEPVIKIVNVVDSNTVVGNILYCAAAFNFNRCNAGAEATMPCRVMALEDGDGLKEVLLSGEVTLATWSWSAGPIYVSTAAGQLTQTAPAASGDQVQIVGWALSAIKIHFKPDSTLVEIA